MWTVKKYRWKICALLFFATTINYVDRHVLGILAPQLQEELHWTDSQYGLIVTSFQVAYALGFLFIGNVIDKIGTRLGYSISIVFWSVAGILHCFAKSATGFAVARFGLGLGEAGNFPSAVKAVAEWFPRKERAFITGIFVSGSSIGAMIAPFAVPIIALHYGWQAAFIFTGASGFVWLFFWLITYRSPDHHKKISKEELENLKATTEIQTEKISWFKLLKYKQTWAFAIGKLLTDPVFSFFFFLPKFFYTNHGISLSKIGPPIMVIYLMSDVGSIAGGWFSSFLLKRGWSLNASRKTAMLVAAITVTPVYFASQTDNLWVAVGLIGLALAAHQAWSANLFTISSDMFPQQTVASVVGIGSTVGAIGGMFGAASAGYLLEKTGSYTLLFIVAGSTYLLALAFIHLLAPKLKHI